MRPLLSRGFANTFEKLLAFVRIAQRAKEARGERRAASGERSWFVPRMEAERLIWSSAGLSGDNPTLPSAGFRFPFILCPGIADGLPLHVRGRVRTATCDGHNVILDVARAGAARPPSRWTRVR
jgi:hypothetical protein